MFIEPDTRKIFPRKLGIKLEQIILEKGEFEHFWSDLIELTIILYHLSKEQKRFEAFKHCQQFFTVLTDCKIYLLNIIQLYHVEKSVYHKTESACC